jgi:hypothetical protein
MRCMSIDWRCPDLNFRATSTPLWKVRPAQCVVELPQG